MSLVSSYSTNYKSIIGFTAVVLVAVIIGWQIYNHWPIWLQISIGWQKQLNQGLSTLLQETHSNPVRSGGLLILISFLYGFLHALGPGHGKLIITTYIATQATQLRQSVIISLCSSLLQGLVAIGLVSAILIVFQLSTKHLNIASIYAEKISYLIVILLGVTLCLMACRQWLIQRKKRDISFRRIQNIPVSIARRATVLKPISASENTQLCSCGHQHVISPQDMQLSLKSKLLIILSMGMRPCSGALLVLLFSYVIDAYWWGIIAALVMATGTALTISLIALFVHYMRDSALKVTQLRYLQASPHWGIGLKIFAGIVFILLGLLMYQSVVMSQPASPFMAR